MTVGVSKGFAEASGLPMTSTSHDSRPPKTLYPVNPEGQNVTVMERE